MKEEVLRNKSNEELLEIHEMVFERFIHSPTTMENWEIYSEDKYLVEQEILRRIRGEN